MSWGCSAARVWSTQYAGHFIARQRPPGLIPVPVPSVHAAYPDCQTVITMPRKSNLAGRSLTLQSLTKGGWQLTGTCIVKRGNRFAVMVYAGIDPETKRPRWKWHGGFRTRREADTFRATLAHHPAFSAGAGIYGTTRLRTGDYLDDWLRNRRSVDNLEEKTSDRYEQFIRVHWKPAIGHVPLVRLSPQTIQESYGSLLKKGLSRTTVHHAAVLLRTAMNDAVRRGIIARNPVVQTDPPSRDTKSYPVLTPGQTQAYLEDARQTAPIYVWALYFTKVGTGMRFGELLGLRESDVDLEAGCLRLEQALKQPGPQARFGRLKTARSRRTITLPAEVVDALRQLRKWKVEQRLRRGSKFHEHGLVFCGPSGKPLHQNNIRYRDHFPRIERLKLPRVRPHDLRHGHATYLVAAGVDPRTVADRLGHSSPAFTMRVYVHGVSEAQRRAADVASKLLVKLTRSATGE